MHTSLHATLHTHPTPPLYRGARLDAPQEVLRKRGQLPPPLASPRASVLDGGSASSGGSNGGGSSGAATSGRGHDEGGGHGQGAVDYGPLVEAGREAVLRTLELAGVGDVRGHIVSERVIEPAEWRERWVAGGWWAGLWVEGPLRRWRGAAGMWPGVVGGEVADNNGGVPLRATVYRGCARLTVGQSCARAEGTHGRVLLSHFVNTSFAAVLGYVPGCPTHHVSCCALLPAHHTAPHPTVGMRCSTARRSACPTA